MDIWLNIGYLSHILAGWFIISLILGTFILSALTGGFDSKKDTFFEITKGIFIPVVELVLAFKSIHVPLTGILLIGLVIFGVIADKVRAKSTNPTVTTTTPEVSK